MTSACDTVDQVVVLLGNNVNDNDPNRAKRATFLLQKVLKSSSKSRLSSFLLLPRCRCRQSADVLRFLSSPSPRLVSLCCPEQTYFLMAHFPDCRTVYKYNTQNQEGLKWSILRGQQRLTDSQLRSVLPESRLSDLMVSLEAVLLLVKTKPLPDELDRGPAGQILARGHSRPKLFN